MGGFALELTGQEKGPFGGVQWGEMDVYDAASKAFPSFGRPPDREPFVMTYFATLKATDAVVVSHISRNVPLAPVTSVNTNVNCSIE